MFRGIVPLSDTAQISGSTYPVVPNNFGDAFSNPILSATMAGRDYPQASEETISENDLEERILDAKDDDQDLTAR